MRFRDIGANPVAELPYLAAGTGGRAQHATLPLLLGRVEGLPPGVTALLCTSDLQGRGVGAHAGQLLGVAVASWLQDLAEEGLVPSLSSLGAVLAGDLYAAPRADLRGAAGDVRPVWEAFRERFCWVAGVPGNHDEFGPETPADFSTRTSSHVLDGQLVELDGLRVAGLGGVIGRADKPHRRDERAHCSELAVLLRRKPDVLVLHEGPVVPERELLGHPAIRQALRAAEDTLVVAGHAHWPTPWVRLPSGPDVLNVDGRVVLLTAS